MCDFVCSLQTNITLETYRTPSYIMFLNAAPAASFTISNDFRDRREKSFRPQKMLNI